MQPPPSPSLCSVYIRHHANTNQEREAGRAMDVIVAQTKPLADKLSKEQWSKIVVAYEPVW